MKKSVFIHVDGGLMGFPLLADKLKELTTDASTCMICAGGGSLSIIQAYAAAGVERPEPPGGLLGLRFVTEEERTLVKGVLKENFNIVSALLAEKSITATLITPIVSLGPVDCVLNVNQIVVTAYNDFDKLFVLTTPEEVNDRERQFIEFQTRRVVVIGLQP